MSFWSNLWNGINSTSGMYGDNSFEGAVQYTGSAPIDNVDNLLLGKPLDEVNSAQVIDNTPVVPKPDSPGDQSPRYYTSVPVNKPEYINAALAKAYGMDVATAYQEALANTAHQREIKDLQAAGLNPVLSARYSGASGVSGASVMQTSGSRSSGSSSSDSPLGKLLAGAGLLTGIVAGIATKNPQVTTSIASASRLFSSLFD